MVAILGGYRFNIFVAEVVIATSLPTLEQQAGDVVDGGGLLVLLSHVLNGNRSRDYMPTCHCSKLRH